MRTNTGSPVPIVLMVNLSVSHIGGHCWVFEKSCGDCCAGKIRENDSER